MTRFDRHLLIRLLRSYVLLVVALIAFFIILHYVEYIDDFYDRGATFRQVFLSYYPNYIPEIVRLISPLALFMSVVYIVGRMSQGLEIAALQTSGVSLYRLLLGPAVLGLAVTGAIFWFNGWVVPNTNKAVLEFERRYLRDAHGFVDVTDMQTGPGGMISIGFYDRENQVGHRTTLQQFSSESRLAFRIDSPRMVWIDSLSVWRFEDPVTRSFDRGRVETVVRTVELDTTINLLPRDFARSERDVESMTIPEAAAHISALRRAGAANIGRARVQYQSKFAYPISNFILAVLGMTLASVRRRGGQAIQIGIGLILAFAYLTMLKVLEPFGFSGSIPSFAAAWAAHVLFGVGTLLYLIRVRK